MGKADTDKTKRNKVYFRILSWILVLVFFALAELLLRLFSYGTDMHLFVEQDSNTQEKFMKVNPYVGEKYFTRFEATTGTEDVFLKKKPDNGYRVFLLGSSTIYGYPYGRNLMASRILHQRLQDAFPNLTVEVINTSITAINSITLKDFADQVLKNDPDALLIYAGHNEYYGAFGVGSNETLSKSPFILSVHLKLIHLRIYQLMRSAVGGIAKGLTKDQDASEASGTLMKRIVGDENIEYQGEKYQVGVEQYRKNLSHILKKAAKNDVPVYLSDLVSNIKDLTPFGNTEGEELSAQFTYEKALRVLAGGDTLEARALFYRAKDLDPIRFRASEEINEIIYELAEEYQANLVPAKEWFSNASPGGLIGNQLITEHVHPNIEGQFVLADAFYSSIVNSAHANDLEDPRYLKSKEYYRHNWEYTDLDSLIGTYKIEYLKSHWPFAQLGEDNVFLNTFRSTGVQDSLAFSILTDPNASFQSLHRKLAEHYEQEGELYLELQEYKALIRSNPQRSTYYTMAGTCLLKLNDLAASESYLRKSMKHDQDLFAYSLLGEIESIKYNFRDAADLYKASLELTEKDQFQNEEGRALVQDLGRKLSSAETRSMNPAPSVYSEYPKYIPLNIEHLYNRAFALSDTDSDSALYYYTRCLEINDCPLVNFRIGNILYQKRDLTVMHYYDKAYEGFARDPDFLIRYCVSCLYNQEVDKAKEIYRFLALIAPRHPELPNLAKSLEN